MEITLTCKRCGKVWIYTGEKKPNKKYPIYVSCPECRANVKLMKEAEA